MPSFPSRLLTHLACVLLACLAAGCQRKGSEPAVLVVFAAASLREPFEQIAAEFERRHPDLEVRLNTAGTQQLALQLEHGAAVDLFAAADPRIIDRLARDGLVDSPRPFARNELVIVVPKGNPLRIAGLADLERVERLVLAAPEVPVGRYSRELLLRAEPRHGEGFAARIENRSKSGELSARQVLARVALGEADAGIVYRTDVSNAPALGDDVEAIALEEARDVTASYTLAVSTRAPQPQLAKALADLVLGPTGQQILAQHGFLPPPAEGAP